MTPFRTGLLIGVLAAAVVALVIALIVSNDDSSTTTVTSVASTAPTESGTTTSPARQTTTATTTTESSTPVAFRSPTGNIICKVSADEAVCSINEFSYRPPPPPSSCVDSQGWGHAVGVQGSGSGNFICADNQVADPGSPVLAYGRGVLVGASVCASSHDGVRCANRDTRHGFLLSRQRVQLY